LIFNLYCLSSFKNYFRSTCTYFLKEYPTFFTKIHHYMQITFFWNKIKKVLYILDGEIYPSIYIICKDILTIYGLTLKKTLQQGLPKANSYERFSSCNVHIYVVIHFCDYVWSIWWEETDLCRFFIVCL